MDYLERYRRDECEQVWAELQGLGPGVREEPVLAQARLVAEETMRRVRRNCERLIERLTSLGYRFGVNPDESTAAAVRAPLMPPEASWAQDIQALEQAAGPLPLSLVAFWQQVGAVDLVGLLRSWPSGLDTLVIYSPGKVRSLLNEAARKQASAGVVAPLAPDAMHKDNLRDGDPYSVSLPEAGADFLFRHEKHNLYFVSYLRFAILRFGGFPGLEGGSAEFDALPTLLNGLEPF